jgi:predicted DNA binding CopG/RHH family protein
MKADEMLEEYDFSNSQPNPYYKRLKKQVTMRLDNTVIDYFKEQAEETGLPYQSIINLYLNDCVKEGRKLTFV